MNIRTSERNQIILHSRSDSDKSDDAKVEFSR